MPFTLEWAQTVQPSRLQYSAAYCGIVSLFPLALVWPHRFPVKVHFIVLSWSLNDMTINDIWYMMHVQEGFFSFPLKILLSTIKMYFMLIRDMHSKTNIQIHNLHLFIYSVICYFLILMYDVSSCIWTSNLYFEGSCDSWIY